jgi:hypothetical protein
MLAFAGMSALGQDLLWEVRLDDYLIRQVVVLESGAVYVGAYSEMVASGFIR